MSSARKHRTVRVLPVMLVTCAVAAATLTATAHSSQSAATAAPPTAPAAPAPAAEVHAMPAARTVGATTRTAKAAPDRRTKKKASRNSLRPSAAPYRFATKKFNKWYAKRYIAVRYGWHRKQMRCLAPMWGKESAWNERAHNNGSGAHGIPQAMPGQKMAKFGKNWRTNPMTQIKWGAYYIKAVYKTPCRAWSFWRSHRWY